MKFCILYFHAYWSYFRGIDWKIFNIDNQRPPWWSLKFYWNVDGKLTKWEKYDRTLRMVDEWKRDGNLVFLSADIIPVYYSWYSFTRHQFTQDRPRDAATHRRSEYCLFGTPRNKVCWFLSPPPCRATRFSTRTRGQCSICYFSYYSLIWSCFGSEIISLPTVVNFVNILLHRR